MTALDHYRDQIQQALKQAPMSQLPEPLATIAYLLACGNDANAAGLAEFLASQDTVMDFMSDGIQKLQNRVYELSDELAAALREGAG